jgi:sporulation protein YlmC with PRC-barrel domain
MKTNRKHKLTIISASAVSLLALGALGQSTINQPTGQTESSSQSLIDSRAENLSGSAKASEVIGMTVNNLQDEKLGKVSDLAVDMESGRVVQVIIATGGFLGIGSALTAVPPGTLHHDVTQKVLHLDVSKQKFADAPKFDSANWNASTQSNRLSEVYGYYGQQPYFAGNREGYALTTANGALANQLGRNMDGTINTEGARSVDKMNNAKTALILNATNNLVASPDADGTLSRNDNANARGANSSGSSLGYVQKASKLMGTSVKNLQNETLGKVENFTVDLAAGRVVAVIISSGGFLGMGDELSAIPPSALKFNAENDTLQLDATKESLASSPHFKANEWPDLSQPSYVGGVYRAYNVEPYFTTNITTGADNTRLNVRDRDSRTLTPLDQGNSQPDVSTTAQIRKEIIATQGMTMNAKNIKIITQNGRVTLRGPVNTTEEKNRIGEIAERIAKSGNVDNQLEITTTPGNY